VQCVILEFVLFKCFYKLSLHFRLAVWQLTTVYYAVVSNCLTMNLSLDELFANDYVVDVTVILMPLCGTCNVFVSTGSVDVLYRMSHVLQIDV